MPTGTITRVFAMRGFGYITPDEGDRDVFVRTSRSGDQLSPVEGTLREGERVSFEIRDSDSGLQAVSVTTLR